MTIQPKTVENELIQEANELLAAQDRFMDKGSFAWRSLWRRAEPLIQREPYKGWAVIGTIHGIAGDLEETDRSFRASYDLNREPTTVYNWIGNLANLGSYVDALRLYREAGSPKRGAFCYLFSAGVLSHAYRTAAGFYEEAQAMKMDTQDVDPSAALEMSKFLEQAGITDDDIASHLTVAGQVLRKHGIPFRKETDLKQVLGVLNGITIPVGVPVGHSEAFDMNIELAMAEDEAGIQKHPGFDIDFAAR